MNIFLLNRGSSSIKCTLYRFDRLPEHSIPPLWEARIEWKNNFEHLHLSVKNIHGAHHTETLQSKSLLECLKHAMHCLFQSQAAVLTALNQIDVVGHRIVHGGADCTRTVRITKQVKKSIRGLRALAPLHTLGELEAIDLVRTLLPKTVQCAIFDTAFHNTLPKEAFIYPGPYAWYEEGIRRFGFHGTSFHYCTRRTAELAPHAKKVVICHLGSGASLCAVLEGKSVDTTMGLTPLEGLMMDTRSGSIDPGVLLYLLKKRTKLKDLHQILYERSGLLGLSGTSSDMRDVIAKLSDERAHLAFDVYVHRLCACIGSMIASLQGVDALVFTAGIGENVPLLRKKVCDAFSFLGMQLDSHHNEAVEPSDRCLSTPTSKVTVLLIHTQEAFEMARECWFLKKR